MGWGGEGGGGAEDKPFDPLVLHDFTEAKSRTDVVAVVGEGLADRFANGLEASKMNGRVNLILIEDHCKCSLIGAINDMQRYLLTGDFLYSFECFLTAVAKVIDNDY